MLLYIATPGISISLYSSYLSTYTITRLRRRISRRIRSKRKGGVYTCGFHSRELSLEIDYISSDEGGYIAGYGVISRLSGFIFPLIARFQLGPIFKSIQCLFRIEFLVVVLSMTVFAAGIVLKMALILLLYSSKRRIGSSAIFKFNLHLIVFLLLIFAALLNQSFVIELFLKKVDAQGSIRIRVKLYSIDNILFFFKQALFLVIEAI